MKRNESFQLVDRFHWSVSIGCFKKFHQFIKGVSDCEFWEVTPTPPNPKGFVWLEHLRSSTRSTEVCLWGYDGVSSEEGEKVNSPLYLHWQLSGKMYMWVDPSSFMVSYTIGAPSLVCDTGERGIFNFDLTYQYFGVLLAKKGGSRASWHLLII